MIESLNNKSKCLILSAFTILFLILSYFLSIKKTVVVIEKNCGLKKNIEVAKDAPSKISEIREQILIWDQNLLKDVDIETIQLRILNEINMLSNESNLKVIGLNRVGRKIEKDIVIETHEVSLSGEYLSLVTAIYSFEHKIKFANISSLAFEIVKNRKKKRDELVLRFNDTVYI